MPSRLIREAIARAVRQTAGGCAAAWCRAPAVRGRPSGRAGPQVESGAVGLAPHLLQGAGHADKAKFAQVVSGGMVKQVVLLNGSSGRHGCCRAEWAARPARAAGGMPGRGCCAGSKRSSCSYERQYRCPVAGRFDALDTPGTHQPQDAETGPGSPAQGCGLACRICSTRAAVDGPITAVSRINRVGVQSA